ncbi:hypothetical protein A2890_00505 [candidate division WWE3 bacterium RIFCSPLOWO2_01_FULL_53_14]|uniref:DUF5673 domain-containing protein n=1 Tax=candidate division WWE3 bacterium RIFCSPLOWO2_01_FULL_53_14 TaxID=1802628 RepID=A0A1F4VZV9_UNCKA|nr:MAG: hypothetical protein A2890_00505 [candidate division WWE3 bacterium RIFCSPLOWO2_01_FULL_53_14]
MPDKQIEEERTLFSWEAPDRIYTKRGKTYFKNLFTLLGVLAAVAIFFKEFLLAGVLGAFGFLQWVLSTNPPKVSRHTITNRGIKTHAHDYEWDQLKDFWFAEHAGQLILHIDTKTAFPGRLYLLLGKADRDEVTEVLSRYLSFQRQAKEDLVEKISVEVSRRFPLE